MSKLLSKDDILNIKSDRTPVKVTVEEWGGDVYLSKLSTRELIEFGDQVSSHEQTKIGDAVSLVYALVDKDGKKLFDQTDAKALADRNYSVVRKLVNKWLEINKIGAGAIENESKN